MRKLGAAWLALAVLGGASVALPAAAFAEVRTGQVSDPQDSANNPLDIEQIRASLDRDAGTLAMTVRVYGGYPDTSTSSSTYVFATMGVNSAGGCSNYQRGGVFASIREDGGAWTAYVSVQGEYGERSQTVPVSITGDRREASFSATDDILRGADNHCFEANSSYGDGPYDPDQPGGHPEDSAETGYFDGFTPPPENSYGIPCDGPQTNLAYSGSGNPRFIAWGQTGWVESYTDRASSSHEYFTVAAADPADPIAHPYTRKQTRSFQDFPVRVARGDGPIRVQTSWKEDGCPYYSEMLIETGRGQKVRARARRVGNTVFFEYPRGAKCVRYRPTKVRVVVRGSGHQASLADKDLCNRAVSSHGRGGIFSLRADRRDVWLRTRSVRRNITWNLHYAILVNGARTRTGSIVVKNKYRPGRRVYAWKPGLRSNDEYWNYCVNRGKQTWMHKGNAYCIRPAHRSQRIRLR